MIIRNAAHSREHNVPVNRHPVNEVASGFFLGLFASNIFAVVRNPDGTIATMNEEDRHVVSAQALRN